MDNKAKKPKKSILKKNPAISKEAKMAYEKWRTYFKSNIDQYHMMNNFVWGKQWTEDEETTLTNNKKIPLTANKLPTLINYLLGEQQQNTPQLQVVPMTSASQETAHIRELIIKDITLSNDSQTVYQVMAKQSYVGGYSAYLIDTEYRHATAWEQNIVPHWIKDPTKCFWDISAQEISKVDGMCGGYEARISKTKFKQLYGKKALEEIVGNDKIAASKEEIAAATDTNPNAGYSQFNWADEDSVAILHYYKRTYVSDTLYKLSNGDSVTQAELDEIKEYSHSHITSNPYQDDSASMEGMLPQMMLSAPPSLESSEVENPDNELQQSDDDNEESEITSSTLFDVKTGDVITVEEKRDIKKSKIIHYKISGEYELDRSECAAEDIPIPFVDHDSYFDQEGRQVCRSFLHDCIDIQKYINYLRTQCGYVLKMTRYDQFIGSKMNVQSNDTSAMWKDPQRYQGMLYYDESPTGAKPEQLQAPELSQSLLTQYELAVQDLYTSTGIYPTQMGGQGKEISGDALDSRNRQGSITSQVPLRSIDRAVAAGAQIINGMIPKVYDTERVISLMSPDEGMKNYTINKPNDAYGAKIENDIRKGTFQVRLKPGPSLQGQKDQARESLEMVLKANPQVFNLIADLWAESLPLVNNIELKNRLRTLVPPEIIQVGKTGKSMPPKPQQPTPEQQALMLEVQWKQKDIEIKEKELMIKAEQQKAENQLEAMKLENERLKVASTLQASEFKYMAEDKRTESNEQIAHADNLVKILTHKISPLTEGHTNV